MQENKSYTQEEEIQRVNVRDVWIPALRSGKYEQGKHALCEAGKYCCLGIASEEFLQEASLRTEVTDDFSTLIKFADDTLYAPSYVKEATGLLHNNGATDIGNVSLGVLNDRGHTFNEIADILEECLADGPETPKRFSWQKG